MYKIWLKFIHHPKNRTIKIRLRKDSRCQWDKNVSANNCTRETNKKNRKFQQRNKAMKKEPKRNCKTENYNK